MKEPLEGLPEDAMISPTWVDMDKLRKELKLCVEMLEVVAKQNPAYRPVGIDARIASARMFLGNRISPITWRG